ncbi:MAG: VCBS repeat-containing protein [Gammaproteobacteria bacterium]|nr:VCBS repeat-containing protein [Gammaproteobacteria bacterium]
MIALTMSYPSAGISALVDRGGGLIYDTSRNITWLQDANYAKTSGYDADGLMTWSEAVTWAANLSYFDSVRGVVYDNWRLPNALNADGSGPCYGYNCIDSEMGHLYSADSIRRDNAVLSSGPFKNFKGSSYWYSTPVAGDAIAWLFTFGIGMQNYTGPTASMLTSFAWAVREGDVAIPASSSIRFSDVTNITGINHAGPSFGASWGDFNGDGRPDLWVGNHYATPSLYINNGNGAFTDVVATAWPGPLRDNHGAAWADFDRDGDQDLMEVVGGGGDQLNQLWVNEAGTFRDAASELNAGSPGARSRTPLWFDWDQDGYLDLVLTQAQGGGAQPYVMRNNGAGFVDVSATVGVNLDGTTGAYLSDLTGDGKLDLAVQSAASTKFPAMIYSTGSTPFVQHPELSNAIGGVSDAVFADFNGDLKSDIFTILGAAPQQLVVRSSKTLEFRMGASGNEKAVTFKAGMPVQLSVSPGVTGLPIYTGQGSMEPAVTQTPELGWGSFSVTLDPGDPAFSGMPPHNAGVDRGFFIGFDAITSTWTVSLSSPTAQDVRFIASSTGNIQNAKAVGFSAMPGSPQPSYLLRTATGFEQRRAQSGLSIGMPCFSAVAGDFDNDMDVDLYLACTYGVSNASNILLENLGNGTFTLAPMAGGAAGSSVGRSESVTTADYDQDGFLDLFLTNGEGGEPFNNGPHQLFRNLGNGNKWIELDLVGRFSNPHGIGAVVTVTAGGKTQMREQNGGIHNHAQNFQRLHVGLGAAQLIDQIDIAWPSGIRQILRDVAPNQILVVAEIGTSSCSDGVDNDGDGRVDFPADSDCSSLSGTTEEGARGGVFQQGAGTYGYVSMEAEHFSSKLAQGNHDWLPIYDSAYIDGAAMFASPNIGKSNNTGYLTKSPRMDFQINFVKTGVHYLWLRGFGGTGNDNSVHAGLDGAAVGTSDRIRFPTSCCDWTQSTHDGPVATINVTSAGAHTLNIWMREDGLILDKLILTTDKNIRPSGSGVQESYRVPGN